MKEVKLLVKSGKEASIGYDEKYGKIFICIENEDLGKLLNTDKISSIDLEKIFIEFESLINEFLKEYDEITISYWRYKHGYILFERA